MNGIRENEGRLGGERCLGVDFWRGLALLTIFVNHIPGNIFEHLTHRNFGFSDATEAFVLLAGVAAALAYLPRFREGGPANASFRVVQRAFQIYMAHIVLIVCCGAIIAYAVRSTGDTRFLDAFQLNVLIKDTIPGLIGLATLGLQPNYLNILPLYIVLLLMTPPLLFLARRNSLHAIGAAGVLYVVANLYWLNVPTFPEEGNWFLNPLCWLLLFSIGIGIGDMIQTGRPAPRSRLLLAASLIYLAISMVWIRIGFFPWWDLAPVPRFLWDFDKTNLFLPRLVHVLALTYVLAWLPVESWLRAASGVRPIIVLGRHSLPVFCLGTVLAVAGQMLRGVYGGSAALDVILIGSGILLQLLFAGILEWYRIGQTAPAARSETARAR